MIEPSWAALAVVGTAAVGVLFACLMAVFARVTSDEVSGWLPVWSTRLLDSAVSIVPVDHQERYRKEWRAELAAFNGRRLSGLRFAWRLRRRAHSMHDALREAEQTATLLEADSPPVEVKPLDAEIVAAIVRRAVDKSKPADRWAEEELFATLMESLESLDVGQQPAEITRRYFKVIAGDQYRDRWRSGRIKQIWRSRLAPPSTPPLWDIERDVARRQRASDARRQLVRKRRRRFRFR